jgi:homoserine kinase type II
LAVRPLAGGGLSGEPVFAVTAAIGTFILKPFSERMSRSHAEWVHELMRHCRTAGVATVPPVMTGDRGASVLAADGRLWELVGCMPGRSVPRPSSEQRAAAARMLAHIHRASVSLAGTPPRRDPSPGMQRRVAHARELAARPWSTRDCGPGLEAVGDLVQRAVAVARAAGPRGIARAAATVPRPMLLHAVVRDVWSDHVLFVGDDVTGVIDWHAAGIDTPATDIARLVGSWRLDAEATEAFIAAYETMRPLSTDERGAIPFLRAAGVVCAIDNWFRWLLDERRTFADMPRVVVRLEHLIDELPSALEQLASGVGEAR